MSTPTMPGPEWRPSQLAAGGTAQVTPTAPPQPAPSRADRWEGTKPLVRIVGCAVIGLLAIVTVFGLAPQAPASDSSADRLAIWADDDANQELTEGAPQQTVVNGWTGNALLDLISEQLDRPEPVDQRPAVLLALIVLLLGIGLATAPRRS